MRQNYVGVKQNFDTVKEKIQLITFITISLVQIESFRVWKSMLPKKISIFSLFIISFLPTFIYFCYLIKHIDSLCIHCRNMGGTLVSGSAITYLG